MTAVAHKPRPHPQRRAFNLVLDALSLYAAAVRREHALKLQIHGLLQDLAEVQAVVRRCEGEFQHDRVGDNLVERRVPGYRHQGMRGEAARRRADDLDGLTDGERAWDAFDALPADVQAAEWAKCGVTGCEETQ